MSKISDAVLELSLPIAEEMGFDVYDTEYVKEGSENYLRIYIDKEEGISSDDCALFSRAMDPVLDEADLIDNHYVFEVCSPGIERRLRLEWHYEQAIGEKVRVKCFKAVEGKKEHVGILISYGQSLVLNDGQNDIEIEKANISMCRIAFDF